MNEQHGVTRRGLLGVGAGAALAGAVTGVAGTYAAQRAHAVPSPAAAGGAAHDPSAPVPFHGIHQAGITTPAQDRLHFVALDVTTDDREQLVETLRAWTRAAERMTAGAEAAPGGVVGGGPYGVPEDTGEAYDLEASGLTITIGFGPSLFDGRFGLADRLPEGFADLPAFRGDDLDPARCGGDIGIQACANDPQVAVHAIRNLVRIGFGTVSVRWSQLGFGRTSSTSTSQVTARNLFGFKDGTNNLKAEGPGALAEHVWVQPEDVPGATSWMVGGSYLVARRIRMHVEVWDRTNLQEQEQVIGRTKGVGAPLGQRQEFDTVDLAAKGADGQPAIPETAHIRLASPETLDGVRLLRRGYNFTDGSDGVGHLDAGLFFIAFCRDAGRQFVPMQRALAGTDALNEYIEHNGSAVFACPPGVEPGGWWGETLFS
ncbi:iron uptake transporter deferrochelatase/peroxidase subunit [Knoellia sp. 3-2P3]|uniref:iron uptake transporter deferrochelatase/peroxidase subunit n=1 Tax=unclassified Knoellia TaxID=2618719 RepID=UPI0023DBBB06|nr:iron uptake transporter deferrochelatase/peroxidase subunit [Knoellia sp. 3-2P3]MDF2091196.1 iron uptake transporter deferrochelatase/peroxidase subunit [Knoellia sp. 3-2P3]